jgi:uncharacterized protein (TIGR02687 family)
MTQIQQTLESLFTNQRLVFWYDEQGEFQEDFDTLKLSKVHKLVINNNEFAIKLEVVQEHPKTKFLIYSSQAKPADHDNWLLDLNLSNAEFFADQESMLLQELGLDQGLRPFLKQHKAFTKSKERVGKLKELIKEGDSTSQLAGKMMAVLCGLSTDNLDTLLFTLLEDEATEGRKKIQQLEKYELLQPLWQELEARFSYRSESPSVYDFAIELFNTVMVQHTGVGKSKLSRESLVFMNRWQDSVRYQEAFRLLSDRIAKVMNIDEKIQTLELKTLKNLDIYEVVDRKILSEIKQRIINETSNTEAIAEILLLRSEKFWYERFKDFYEAVGYAVKLLDHLRRVDFSVKNFNDGLKKYTHSWHEVDTCYRKFILHMHNTGSNTFLSELQALVEGRYTNHFLMNLNDSWQKVVDRASHWGGQESLDHQQKFFSREIEPFIKKNKKIYVVISDALRYESGVELNERINKEPKFSSKLGSMLSGVPSVTSLGMASLLPHKTLELTETLQAKVDGKSTQGTTERAKVLNGFDPKVRGIAIKADDFLALNSTKGREELAKNYDVIYIYSNEIDATGDKRETETRVFEATEDEFERIIKILRKICNLNGSNAIITSDHGYLYQESEVADSDFTEITEQKDELVRNRRFIAGKTLAPVSNAKHYTSEQLNVLGSFELLVPKSCNRLRVRGAGSRFVHGGTSLQEVIVPVIKFNRVRDGEIENVDVDLIRSNPKITSNQLTVRLYQCSPISEEVQPIKLRVSFQAADGTSLSNREDLIFESTDDNAQNRERTVAFTFSKDANKFNNQDVFLMLEMAVPGASQYAEYKRFAYRMMITFGTDFDEF